MDVGEDGDAHGGRTVAKAAAAGIVGAAWVVAGVVLWRTRVPAGLQLPHVDPASLFGADELDRIERYRRVSRALLAGSLVLEALVLVGFVLGARRAARRARRLGRGAVRTGVILGVTIAVAVWLVQLPLGAVGHWWALRYGLSHQGWGGWFGDAVTNLGIQVVVSALAVAAAVWLARRLGRRWGLAGAPLVVGAAVAFILIQPLVVQPLLNDFRPLRDRALAGRIEAIAAREGVDVGPPQVADASRRTTTANAYVAGIGPTRRVVFWDTILDGRFPEPELRFVAAHELAHVGRRHLWKGLGWFAIIAVPTVAAIAWVTNRRGGLADPALVPLALLVAFVAYVGTLPLQNAVSRRYEAEADWLALEATHDPSADIGLERRFVRTSLSQPDPPGWVTFWFGTHPTPAERIGMARAFETLTARGGS